MAKRFITCFWILVAICGNYGCQRSGTSPHESQREVISETAVKIGMSRSELLKRFGKPSQVIADPKGGETLTFLVGHESLSEGRQMGGLIVIVEDNIVIETRPIYVHRREH